MKTCTLFITQCILVAAWVLVAICFQSNNLLIFGLLAIIVLNIALLFYCHHIDFKRDSLCFEKLDKEITDLTAKLKNQEREISNINDYIKQKKEEENKKEEKESSSYRWK